MTFLTLGTVACQAPLSMRFSKARILECVVMPSSRGSSQSRDQIQVSCRTGVCFFVVVVVVVVVVFLPLVPPRKPLELPRKH